MSTQHYRSRFITSAVLLSLIPACVSTHAGHPVSLASAPVKVSCSYGADIQTQSISGIVCNLENLSRSWQDLTVRSVRFPDQPDAKVVAAADLQALAEAMALKKSADDYNAAMALGGLVLTGAVLALGSSNPDVGRVVMVGGTTAAGVRDVKQAYEKAQYGPAVYGHDHILSDSLRIPSELNIRRQIVIDHPSTKPKSMEVCWAAPQDECIVLPL